MIFPPYLITSSLKKCYIKHLSYSLIYLFICWYYKKIIPLVFRCYYLKSSNFYLYSFIYLFTRSFIQLFSQSFTHGSSHSAFYSFIHSLQPSYVAGSQRNLKTLCEGFFRDVSGQNPIFLQAVFAFIKLALVGNLGFSYYHH